MAKKVSELSVDITGDASGLARALAKASGDVQAAGRLIIGQTSEIQKAITGIGVGVSLGGFAAAVKSAIDYGDNLRDTSRAIGATVEQLSFLDFAAKQSGSSMDELAAAVSRMQRNLGEIAAGRGQQARDALQQLKLDPRDLFRADLITQIQKIGDALNNVQNQSLRSALGQAVLGKNFRAVASLAREGADGVQAMADRFVELNGVVTGTAAEQFDALNDRLGEVTLAWQAMARTIAIETAPALTTVFKLVADAAPAVSRFFGDLSDDAMRSIATFSKWAAQADLAVYQFLQNTLGRVKGFDYSKQIEINKQRVQDAETLARAYEQSEEKRFQATLERQKKLREALSQQAPAADVEINQTAEERAKAAAEAAKKAREAEKDRQDALRESADVENYLSDVVKERAKAFEQAQQKIRADAVAVYEATRTPLEAYTIEVQRLLALPLEDDTLQRGIAKARGELEKSETQAGKTKSAMAELGATFSSAFEDAIVEGKKFSDVLAGIAKDIARLLIRKNITDPIAEAISGIGKSSGSSGGGFDFASIGDLFSKGWGALKSFIPGFQFGGSFQVGGTGGTDSQLVAFRATPGEHVTIGDGPAGSGGAVAVTFQIQANDAAGFDALLAKRRGMITAMVQAAFDKNAKKGIRR